MINFKNIHSLLLVLSILYLSKKSSTRVYENFFYNKKSFTSETMNP